MAKPKPDIERMVLTAGVPSSAVVSGYVTWSSTSWGERPGQSANTITCFSPMSGIASTGVLRSAHPPQSSAASAKRSTRNGFRRHHEISQRASMASVPPVSRVLASARLPAREEQARAALDLGLGVEQERAARHDELALRE